MKESILDQAKGKSQVACVRITKHPSGCELSTISWPTNGGLEKQTCSLRDEGNSLDSLSKFFPFENTLSLNRKQRSMLMPALPRVAVLLT